MRGSRCGSWIGEVYILTAPP